MLTESKPACESLLSSPIGLPSQRSAFQQRQLEELRRARKSLKVVPWLMLVSMLVLVTSALHAGSQDGSFRTPSLRKRALVHRDNCENAQFSQNDPQSSYSQSAIQNDNNGENDSNDSGEGSDDEGLAEASSVAKTTAAPEPSTTTSSKKAAEKTGADKISTKTTIPPTSSTTSSDQPNATPSTPFAPTTCSEGQSTQCCDDNPCTDVDQEGGLSLTECQWQPASSYYYCAYTCTNEGYSMLVANSQATCSQISSDPAKSSGSGSSGLEDQETVITTTDINGDTTVVTTDEDNTGEAGGTGASNKIATAGFTQWFTSCSEAADCSGSFANIQSDCVSSTCSYSCSAGALSECTPGEGMQASCAVAAAAGEELSATCAITCSDGYHIDSEQEQCTKKSGDQRLRWKRRGPVMLGLPEVKPTQDITRTVKHPRWFLS